MTTYETSIDCCAASPTSGPRWPRSCRSRARPTASRSARSWASRHSPTTPFNNANANGNGKRDVGETGLGLWKVYLDLNNNGKLDSTDKVATVDILGNFEVRQPVRRQIRRPRRPRHRHRHDHAHRRRLHIHLARWTNGNHNHRH